jgi:hypothetical protein
MLTLVNLECFDILPHQMARLKRVFATALKAEPINWLDFVLATNN